MGIIYGYKERSWFLASALNIYAIYLTYLCDYLLYRGITRSPMIGLVDRARRLPCYLCGRAKLARWSGEVSPVVWMSQSQYRM